MDLAVLQVVIVSVLSPILIGAGVLYVITIPEISLAAMIFNLLAALAGGLRFVLDISPRYRLSLSFLFVLFFLLSMIADVRLGRRFLLGRTRSRSGPRHRVEVETSDAWVIHKVPGERVAYRVPASFLKTHDDYLFSDLNFRITTDREGVPIEGRFTVGEKAQIMLPPPILALLTPGGSIRFEILE